MGDWKLVLFWMVVWYYMGSRGSGWERIGVSWYFYYIVFLIIWYENCYVGKENICVFDCGYGILIYLFFIIN